MANSTGNGLERLILPGVVKGMKVVLKNTKSRDRQGKKIAMKIVGLSTEIGRLVIAKTHHGNEMSSRWNAGVSNRQREFALLLSEIGKRADVSSTGFEMLGFTEVADRLNKRIDKIDAGLNRLAKTLQQKVHPLKGRKSLKRRRKK